MSDDRGREPVIAQLRPHGRALFWPTVLLLAVVGALTYTWGLLPEQWQHVAAASIAGLLVIVGWFAPLVRWSSTRFTITARRIVVRRGFFVRQRQEVLHTRVHDITLRRGTLQTLFRSGDVILNAGQSAPVILNDVPTARLVQRALLELSETAQPEPDRAREPGWE